MALFFGTSMHGFVAFWGLCIHNIVHRDMLEHCRNTFYLNELHMHCETKNIQLQCQTANPCGGGGGESW
jgi:hypothetical protein